MMDNCGLAQIFDFAIDGEKIWFTEWVENNIGVVDTSVPLPFEIQRESDTLAIVPGYTQEFTFIVSPESQKDLLDVSLILSTPHVFLDVDIVNDTPRTFQLDFDVPRSVHVSICASKDAASGTYKILLGAQSSDVAVSKFVTVTIDLLSLLESTSAIPNEIPCENKSHVKPNFLEQTSSEMKYPVINPITQLPESCDDVVTTENYLYPTADKCTNEMGQIFYNWCLSEEKKISEEGAKSRAELCYAEIALRLVQTCEDPVIGSQELCMMMSMQKLSRYMIP